MARQLGVHQGNMSATFLLLASLAAGQGQAVQLAVPHEAGLASVEAQWGGRTLPFARDGDAWLAVIGVDLEAAPGRHGVAIALRFANGRQAALAEEIVVVSREFPTTALDVEPRYVQLSPEDQARSAREGREIEAIYAAITPERLWHGAFEVPIPGVQGGRNFGHRRIFNGQPRAPHSGADLRASTGTPVRATNRGRVVLAKELFFSGNAVFLDHGLGVYSVYLHLSDIRVARGDVVERGAVIGLAGATGRVTGPHLHWGARILDARIDPFSLLEIGAE